MSHQILEDPNTVPFATKGLWLAIAPDFLLGAVIALAAAIGIWVTACQVPTALLDPRNPDIYFSSDASRVHANMVTRQSNHWRTSVHPLFSIELHPAFVAVSALLGRNTHDDPLSPEAIAVARVMSGIAAGMAAALFFALVRAAGVRRIDAVLFCLLSAVSAFSLYWFSVPETYPWGAVTILCGFVLIALDRERRFPAWWYVTVSVLTLSITTTNWMIGILATWSRFSWRRTIQWSLVALCTALVLAVAQKVIFPSSQLFIRAGGERAYVMQQQSGGPVRCWASFFCHTVVAPAVTTVPHSHVSGQTVMRMQDSAPGSAGGVWSKTALACWGLLLAAGIYAAITLPDLLPLRLALGLALLGQLGLHTIYGAETFLYAAHYGPMMMALAALATRTRLRPVVLSLAALLIVCLTINNFTQYRFTLDLVARSQQRLDALPPLPTPKSAE